MLKKLAAAAVHLVFFALVVAIAGYWGVRIFTPAPTAAPPPLPPPPLRDPDPVATSRMFGKVEVVQAVASNVQAVGAFSAGADSSAVLAVGLVMFIGILAATVILWSAGVGPTVVEG